MQYFNHIDTASGYAKDRPYFHPMVIDKIKSYLNLSDKFRKALDVGCGAGLSSIALLDIAREVTGIDSSESMISSAIKHDRVKYYNCAAEHLPADNEYDIITLSGSLNWIDGDRFFSRARNISKPQSLVIIYDNYFLGKMGNNPSFSFWHKNNFFSKYPKPPRDESPLDKTMLEKYGFYFEHEETYENTVVFSMKKLISYLLTQSNITVALNNGIVNKEELIAWLERSLSGFFDLKEKSFLFGGYIWYVRRLSW